jgi:hypothetical protein
MSSIKNQQAVVAALGRWNPSDVAFIQALHAEADERGELFVRLRVMAQPRSALAGSWPSANREWFEVVFRFDQVRQLGLKGLDGWPRQLMGFAIDDISDRGWEGIRFHVQDYEEGAIEFYCYQVAIESVMPGECPRSLVKT